MEEPAQPEALAYTKLSVILARFPEDQQRQVYLLLKQQIKRRQLHGVLTVLNGAVICLRGGFLPLAHPSAGRAAATLDAESGLAHGKWIMC